LSHFSSFQISAQHILDIDPARLAENLHDLFITHLAVDDQVAQNFSNEGELQYEESRLFF